MNITIVMNPQAAATVERIVVRHGCTLAPTEIQKYFTCRVPRNAAEEDIAQWIMEVLKEVDGVEAASIKPEVDLIDWKVQE